MQKYCYTFVPEFMVKTIFKNKKMKKLFISLCVLAAVSFTACGGAQKAETATETVTETVVASADSLSLVQQYEVLVTKSVEIAKKVQAGDAAAATEFATIQEEVTSFMENNKEALENLTEEEQAEFVKVQEKVAASVAQ